MTIHEGSSFSDFGAIPQSADDRMLEYSMDFVFAVEDRLDELGMSRTDLANKLGCSKSQVTRVLSGANITLRTVAEYDAALGLNLKIKPEDVVTADGSRKPTQKSFRFFREEKWRDAGGNTQRYQYEIG